MNKQDKQFLNLQDCQYYMELVETPKEKAQAIKSVLTRLYLRNENLLYLLAKNKIAPGNFKMEASSFDEIFSWVYEQFLLCIPRYIKAFKVHKESLYFSTFFCRYIVYTFNANNKCINENNVFSRTTRILKNAIDENPTVYWKDIKSIRYDGRASNCISRSTYVNYVNKVSLEMSLSLDALLPITKDDTYHDIIPSTANVEKDYERKELKEHLQKWIKDFSENVCRKGKSEKPRIILEYLFGIRSIPTEVVSDYVSKHEKEYVTKRSIDGNLPGSGLVAHAHNCTPALVRYFMGTFRKYCRNSESIMSYKNLWYRSLI